MRLLQRVEHQLNQTLYIAGGSISLKQLVDRAQQRRAHLGSQLANSSVKLPPLPLDEFIEALLTLDGLCEAIYFNAAHVTVGLPKNSLSWADLNPIGPTAEAFGSDIDTKWCIPTSGTTQTPRWIGHSLVNLTRNTQKNRQLDKLTWVLCYQPFRFAGLQVLLQALHSGAAIIDAHESSPLGAIAVLKQHSALAISATPSRMRQWLMVPTFNKLDLNVITLGGEIADQALLDVLKTSFPEAAIRHIYAATEIGVGFTVKDGKAGFPKSWLTDNPLGVPLKIGEEDTLLCWIDDRWEDSQDVIEVIGDRVFFMGRANGAINVGGNKVMPEQVELALLKVPGIVQARVYGQPSLVLGHLVEAEIVLAEHKNQAEVIAQARQQIKFELPRFAQPRKISCVGSLAITPAGKLAR